MLHGILDGGTTFELTGNFWLPIPPHAMNVALREPGGAGALEGLRPPRKP